LVKVKNMEMTIVKELPEYKTYPGESGGIDFEL
jgi:hypothetical protein